MAVAMYFPMMKGGLAMLAHLLRADASVIGPLAFIFPSFRWSWGSEATRLPPLSLHDSKAPP